MVASVRIGMLTPSSNTVLEPLTSAMLGALPDVSAHFSRFRVTAISTEQDRLDQFEPAPMLGAADLLADARVQAIVWNGTSGGWLGLEADRALCAAIERRHRIPATSVTLALMKLLKSCGARRLAFVTPYTQPVLDRIAATFAQEGFLPVAAAGLGIADNFAFAEVPAETLDRMAAAAAAERPDAILPFCTNLAAAGRAARWEAEHGIPVFDSVAVAVRAGLDCAGLRGDRLRPWGRIFAL